MIRLNWLVLLVATWLIATSFALGQGCVNTCVLSAYWYFDAKYLNNSQYFQDAKGNDALTCPVWYAVDKNGKATGTVFATGYCLKSNPNQYTGECELGDSATYTVYTCVVILDCPNNSPSTGARNKTFRINQLATNIAIADCIDYGS